jgi:tripartite-type tricarboxylate transporter receptor subunit TctC
VENHPGAGATTGPALVAKNLPYDPLKDFIPVASLTNQPYLLVAGKPGGITTVRELIAAAQSNPGKLRFGSTGRGTGTHLGIVKFNFEAGIEVVDVPAGSPTGVVKKLSDDIARVLAGPELHEWIARHGAEPMNMTQPEFARFVQSETEDAARFIKADVKP